MMRKQILVLLIAINCFVLQGQYLENKIDIGIGGGVCRPVSAADIQVNDSFIYPSLFGNYQSGNGIEAFVNYRVSASVRLGIHLATTKFNTWTGNHDIFVLGNPVFTLNTVSVSGFFLPKKLQPRTPHFNWGVFASPGITYELLEWNEDAGYEADQSVISNATTHAGFKAGISLVSELTNYGGLRMDVYYQVQKVTSLYYFDQSLESINLSFYIFFKFLKNRNFMYD